MSEVWQTVLGIIASIGGAGTIILTVVKFTANRLTDTLMQKYQAKIDKDLESYKAELEKEMESYKAKQDKTRYVSKIRFDTEFSLCRELMNAAHKMVTITYLVYPTFARMPSDPKEREKYRKEVWEAAEKSARSFAKLLYQNAPFISREVYLRMSDLYKLCNENIEVYAYRWDANLGKDWENSQDKRKLERECYKRTQEFSTKLEEIVDMLRDYFAQMDISE